MKKKIDICFIIIIILLIIPFYFFLFINEVDISQIENRTLNKHKIFKLSDFINYNFQNNLESAFSDQLLYQEVIKKQTLILRRVLVSNIDNIILKLSKSKKYYVAISNDTYTINNDDYLLNDIDKYKINPKSFEYYNSIDFDNKYLYFIESDASVNYIKKYSNENYNKIINGLNLKAYSKLNVQNYELYKKYFYKTDHHLNKNGQYQAYKDIMKLLGHKHKISVTGAKEYAVYFNGSKARTAIKFDVKEKFCVNVYDNYNRPYIYINGILSEYGNHKKYDLNKYDNNYLNNHYASFYGDDYAEIVFDMKNNSKENLLIISNSYSNSINELIANDFNKTFVIDLRFYKDDINEYIKKNNIDKVLIFGDIRIFNDSYFTNVNLNNI